MKNAERVVALVREWVAKAENDLLTVSHTLTLGTRYPTDALCFHAQQAADALIAATALEHGLPFLTGNSKHFKAVAGLVVERFEP